MVSIRIWYCSVLMRVKLVRTCSWKLSFCCCSCLGVAWGHGTIAGDELRLGFREVEFQMVMNVEVNVSIWHTCGVVCVWKKESNLDWSTSLRKLEFVKFVSYTERFPRGLIRTSCTSWFVALVYLPRVYIEREGVVSRYRFWECWIVREVRVWSLVEIFVSSVVVALCRYIEM